MATMYKLWPAADLDYVEAAAAVTQWFVTRGWRDVEVVSAQPVGKYTGFVLSGRQPRDPVRGGLATNLAESREKRRKA